MKKRELIKAIPDHFFALLALLWWKIHPERKGGIAIPWRGSWLVERDNSSFLVSTFQHAGLDFNSYSDMLSEKYTLGSFVEIERGDTVVDVGSFIGGFSFSASRKASRVFAIEPDPHNFYCLKQNIGFLENVVVTRRLLWKESCKLQLKLGYDASDSSVLNIDGIYRGENISIEAITLSDLIKRLEIKQVDFLKIDARGG